MRIQFCRISSKRKCCENTTLQSYLKGKYRNTTLESCLKWNVLRIEFCRIASKEMFWEYNLVELPQRDSVGIQLQEVAPKECRVRMQFRRIASKRMLLDATFAKCSRKKYYWDATSIEYPRKRYVEMQPLQSALGRNVLMALTQGPNFDFDLIWFYFLLGVWFDFWIGVDFYLFI